MQRLNYAFRFIKENFSLAKKFSELRKPWGNLWMGGITLMVLWFIPLGITTAVGGYKGISLFLMGLFSFLLLLCLFIWGEVSALAASRAYDVVTRDTDCASEKIKNVEEFTGWQEIALWTLMLPGLTLIKWFDQLFRKDKADDHQWTNAAYLMLPLVALEGLNISAARERIKDIYRERLTSFNPQLIPIDWVVAVIKWALIFIGIILGIRIGLIVANPATASVLSRLLAVVCSVFSSGVFSLLGISIGSFNRASYYTALYQRAMQVEFIRYSGDTRQNVTPEILNQVMRSKRK